LLKDINETECAELLLNSLKTMDPSYTISDVINSALVADENFKKLRVAQVKIKLLNASLT
jgi:hypothetical protein